MSTVPNRLQEGTDYQSARPLINDNFDKVAADVTSLGAGQTTTTTVTFSAITTGTTFRQTVVICNPSATSSYSYINAASIIGGVSAIVPSMDVYVDTDNDSTYLYPLGTNLTSSSRALAIDAKLDLTAVDGVASLTISGRNYDASTHTYYVHIKCAYFSSKPAGSFS